MNRAWFNIRHEGTLHRRTPRGGKSFWVLENVWWFTARETWHGIDGSFGQRTGAMNESQVILVDELDRPVGLCDKLAAHQNGGTLHRAFSVFIFNSKGQMLLQKRAAAKYHFGDLWTNACCSHPVMGEATAHAAHRRLFEELGFQAQLTKQFDFIYKATDPGTGLTEHEFDHVFSGCFDGDPAPNPNEVSAWRWIDVEDLLREMKTQPERFTPWFKIALDQVRARRGSDMRGT
jgi:isopentenyl-diphosphate delta-isomerase